jgi:hypothetical protein
MEKKLQIKLKGRGSQHEQKINLGYSQLNTRTNTDYTETHKLPTSLSSDFFLSLVPEMSLISLFTLCTNSSRMLTWISDTSSPGLTSDNPEINEQLVIDQSLVTHQSIIT